MEDLAWSGMTPEAYHWCWRLAPQMETTMIPPPHGLIGVTRRKHSDDLILQKWLP